MVYDFGKRLRELREKQMLSQTQAANRVGITRASISGYENNIMKPSVDVLVDLAILYHTSVDYILGMEHKKMVALDGLNPRQEEAVEQILRSLISEFRLCNRQLDGR